jgi:hypothetical protein
MKIGPPFTGRSVFSETRQVLAHTPKLGNMSSSGPLCKEDRQDWMILITWILKQTSHPKQHSRVFLKQCDGRRKLHNVKDTMESLPDIPHLHNVLVAQTHCRLQEKRHRTVQVNIAPLLRPKKTCLVIIYQQTKYHSRRQICGTTRT